MNGEPVTEADVRFEIQRRAETGRPAGDADELLRDIVRRKAMLQAAARSEVMEDPLVRRELENKQLGQWLDRTLQVERDAVRVTDEELRAHYEAQHESLARPEMVRLAVLYRRVNPREPGETSPTMAEELAKARAIYLADPAAATQQGRLRGFGTLAADYSEDTVSRYRGGDLGWMAAEESGGRIPDAVIKTGRALEVGAVSDVIAAGDGVYLVMKTDRRDSQAPTFEEAATGLRRRLIRLKQEEIERNFMSNLLASARVEINEEKAARLTLPAPAVPEPPALQPVKERIPVREVPSP